MLKSRNPKRSLSYKQEYQDNLDIIKSSGDGDLKISHIDLYPNDICNLRCEFCPTHFGKNNISLKAIQLISKFNPKVMVITGGGEPSLWREDKKKIYDLIMEIRKYMGKIPLGIMSNGTFLMPKEAIEQLKWLRISVNSFDKDQYKVVHKMDMFDRVLKNILEYAKMELPELGIGFVYTKRTARDLINVIKIINDRILCNLSEDNLKKINVQFRPEADPKTYSRHFLDEKLIEELNSQIKNLSEFEINFINEKTNMYEVLNNSVFSLKNFNNCHVSLLQLKIDAKGDVYPCAQTANNYTDSYGNLFSSNFFSNFKKAVKNSYTNHPSKICENCAQSSINHLYENKDKTNNENNDDQNPFF